MAGSAAVAETPEPGDEPNSSAQVEREARALIGWMKPDDAHRILASTRGDAIPFQQHIDMVREAREAVAARAEGLDQAGLVSPKPTLLDHHINELRQSPGAVQMFAEGWDVQLVDLRRVCAYQPSLFSDQAIQRVSGVDSSDIVGIAGITLPLSSTIELPIQFDQIRQAWMVSSANLNLRVAAAPPTPGPNGGPILGFSVLMPASYVQVANYRGRYFLRDGYHRAFGFLSRGIDIVPAFVRELTVFEEMIPDTRGMLPQDSYQGVRPPVVADYLDTAVATSARVPAPHKMIIIQALELTPIG